MVINLIWSFNREGRYLQYLYNFSLAWIIINVKWCEIPGRWQGQWKSHQNQEWRFIHHSLGLGLDPEKKMTSWGTFKITTSMKCWKYEKFLLRYPYKYLLLDLQWLRLKDRVVRNSKLYLKESEKIRNFMSWAEHLMCKGVLECWRILF